MKCIQVSCAYCVCIYVPIDFALYCSYCAAPCLVARRTLYTKGAFAQLACTRCAIITTARKWLCECSTTWVGCPKHAQTGFACHRVALVRTCLQSDSGAEAFSPKRVRKRVSTNDMPPPRAHHVSIVKRPRPRSNGVASSSACASLGIAHHLVDTYASNKRAASMQLTGQRKRKPPHTPASALAAINRLREAREHPI